MQLHDLKKSINNKKKKRVGRGGTRGTYSGRGIKGQKSRSGHKIPSKTKWLIQRFPKLRGIKFNSNKPDVNIVNVSDLGKIFKDKEVTKEGFVNAGIIKNKNQSVKILGDGKLEREYIIKDIPVSKKALKKIEKAGGKVLSVKNE